MLSALGPVLASALDLERALDRVARMVVAGFGESCAISLLQPDGHLRAIATAHRDPGLDQLLRELEERYPITRGGPAIELRAVEADRLEREPAPAEKSLRALARDARHLELLRALRRGDTLVVPLRSAAGPLGTLRISAAPGEPFDATDEGFARELGHRIEPAVQVGLLFAAESEARAEAERAQARLTMIADVGRVMAAAPDFVSAMEGLAELVVRSLGQVCTIDVVRPDGSVRRLAATHADPDKRDLIEELRDRYPPRPGSPHPSLMVMRTGRPVFSEDISQGFMREVARDERHLWLLERLGFRSYVAVPLAARGAIFGAITVISTLPDRRYGAQDVAILEDLARQAALEADKARLLEAEQQARLTAEILGLRTRVLQSVTAGLSAALTISAVAEVMVEPGLAAAGAVAGIVSTLAADGSSLEVVRTYGDREDQVGPGRRLPLDAAIPLAEAFRSGGPVFVRREDGPGRAQVAFPLIVAGRSIGAMALVFPDDRRFDDEDEVAFLAALVDQGAQALDRARLYDLERRERRRRSFLAALGDALAQSLNHERTLAKIARLCVQGVEVAGEAIEGLADWCAVDLLEPDGSIRLAAVEHPDDGRVALAHELRARHPVSSDATVGVPNVLRTGRSELIPEITDQVLAQATDDPEAIRVARELRLASSMIVPLSARGRTFGALTFVRAETEGRYDADDLRFAEEVARLASIALDNARLYRDRGEIARTLQRALRPQDAPPIQGLDVATRYLPAGEGIEVGGDFYEVWEAPGGCWIALGDVSGKGPGAVDLNVLARHTIRTAAMRDDRPGAVLRTLNEAVLGREAGERYCTAVVCRMRIDDEGARLTVASGGHPLPMVVRSGGEVDEVGIPGGLLGMFRDVSIAERTVRMAVGDAVVVYSDGVIEERAGGLQFGVDGLVGELRAHGGSAAERMAEAVEAAVRRFRPGGELLDDVALVVARLTGLDRVRAEEAAPAAAPAAAPPAAPG